MLVPRAITKGLPARRGAGESVGEAGRAARWQVEQLTLVRRRAQPTARLAAVLTELSAAVRACGQLIEADPVLAETAPEPLEAELEDHLAEAHRQQDRLADLLRTDPAENPAGWPLRGEILAHVDRLRTELQPRPVPEPDRVRRRAFMAGAAGRARRGAAGVRPAPGRSSGTPPTR